MIDLKAKPFYLEDEDISWVDKTLKGMTNEEKISQLFCLITYTDDEVYLKYLAGSLKVGGVMTRTMHKEELINTVTRLQENAKFPLLISANLEAGLNQLSYEGLKIAPQMAVAATNDEGYAEKLANAIGEEASAFGINWAFAPVVDVDMNFRNPITNTRTYGSDPSFVKKCCERYVKAMEKWGVATSIKHFPGDGVDERDQHLVASVNTLTVEEWEKSFGNIYRVGIEAGCKTVMVGHILLPEYSKKLNPSLKDEDILPALVSKELLNDLLREKLSFNGLIITDSSTMAGLGTALPRHLAVPMTIAAGCDMFLFTKNLEEDFEYMKKGFEEGVISHERLDDAVTRILALKASLKLHKKNNLPDLERIEKSFSCERHKALQKEIAEKSITLVKEEKGVLPLSPKKYPRVLAYIKEGKKSEFGNGVKEGSCFKAVEALRKEGFKVDVFTPGGGWEGMAKPIKEVTDNYDLIIYFVALATKSNQTIIRIEWAEPMGADVPTYMHSLPTIMVSLENPYHLLDAPKIKTYINTYGGEDCVIESLIDKLVGRSDFVGHSPVDAFCGKWDTRL